MSTQPSSKKRQDKKQTNRKKLWTETNKNKIVNSQSQAQAHILDSTLFITDCGCIWRLQDQKHILKCFSFGRFVMMKWGILKRKANPFTFHLILVSYLLLAFTLYLSIFIQFGTVIHSQVDVTHHGLLILLMISPTTNLHLIDFRGLIRKEKNPNLLHLFN